MHISELKGALARDAYVVDPQAVAEAMLRRGDRLTVTMPYGTFRYAVEGTRIVDPADLRALRTVGHPRLVLSACHPLFSAARRIVVYAAQIGVGQPARRLKRRGDEAR
jgi:LPXTG-site transpeptidase (sortase) family protein